MNIYLDMCIYIFMYIYIYVYENDQKDHASMYNAKRV